MAEYIRIGEPANEAEREGFRLLRDRLPDHYFLLGNFDLRLPNRRTSVEYDAVIIGEYGFYAVEIKGWTGLIRGGDRYWVLPWDRRSNPVTYLDRKTKILGQFVRRQLDDLDDNCFFAPAMLFPRRDVRFDLPESMMRYIVGPDSIYDHFVDLEMVRKKGPGPFRSRERTEEIVEAITAVAEPGDEGVFLSYYDVEGERKVDSSPYREFFGTHRYLHSRSKVRIKAYTIDSLASMAQRREEQNRVLRDMEALEVLDDNPYVARSYEMQPDYEDNKIFYLVSEWVGSRTLRDYIESMKSSQETADDPTPLVLAHHLIEAIQSIHDDGIVHRNINPEVVYLTGCDESVPLKIADFDFARVAKLESIAEAVSTIGTDGYQAPELWLDDDYDHRVDLFSLGAVLYELLTGQQLFRGPGGLLRPEEVWEDRGRRLEDEKLASLIGGLISRDADRRSEVMPAVRDHVEGRLREVI